MLNDSCLSNLAKRHNARIAAVIPKKVVSHYILLAVGLDALAKAPAKLAGSGSLKIIGKPIRYCRACIFFSQKQQPGYSRSPRIYGLCTKHKKITRQRKSCEDWQHRRNWHNDIDQLTFHEPFSEKGSDGRAVIGKGKAGSGPKHEIEAPLAKTFIECGTPTAPTSRAGQPSQLQGHVLTKVGRRGRGGPGILHFRSNLHGPAHVSAIGKLWVLHSSGKRFTVCTNGGEIIQRDTLEEALGVLVESVLGGER